MQRRERAAAPTASRRSSATKETRRPWRRRWPRRPQRQPQANSALTHGGSTPSQVPCRGRCPESGLAQCRARSARFRAAPWCEVTCTVRAALFYASQKLLGSRQGDGLSRSVCESPPSAINLSQPRGAPSLSGPASMKGRSPETLQCASLCSRGEPERPYAEGRTRCLLHLLHKPVRSAEGWRCFDRWPMTAPHGQWPRSGWASLCG
mmetsp:Transcript_13088/g.47765  ORF Transcript_13088/g.47765 Transcript_13088/m.47765 type:complete len:207 (-) Transcript_13088:2176-2796(-)